MGVEPRVLVAIVTYDKERFALEALLESLQSQDFQDFDLLFVDNSLDPGYKSVLEAALSEFFPEERWRVERLDAGEERFSRILKSREQARAHFLAQEAYTHLFFVDSDVLIPKDALSTLLGAGEQLVTGVYLVGKEFDGEARLVPPMLIDLGEGNARQAEINDILEHDRLEIGAAGLGCTLIARDIVEKVSFRLNSHGKGEDIMFYRDAVTACGVQPVALCSVKCQHLHFPVGDLRNDPYDLAKYQLRE